MKRWYSDKAQETRDMKIDNITSMKHGGGSNHRSTYYVAVAVVVVSVNIMKVVYLFVAEVY